MKILKLVFFLLIIAQQNIKAQGKLPSMDYAPQSPSAASFSRYGEIPVDHSTGVPRIEIPIYTMKVGDVSVPITISYHSSGIKVRDISSEIGLGFVLNTGGVVTSTIIGQPDVDNLKPQGYLPYRRASDISNSIYTPSSPQNRKNLSEYFWRILDPNTDLNIPNDHFSDRFYYNLCNGESGIFRKDYITDAIKFLPYRPIQVQMGYPFLNITSSNGFKHSFQATSKDHYVLTKVVSENKTDSILYYYRPEAYPNMNVTYSIIWQFEEAYAAPVDPPGCGEVVKIRSVYQNNLYRERGNDISTAPLLDSIVTKTEVIHFEYASRINEILLAKRLVKISIKNRATRQTIKSITFSHSYFGTVEAKNRRLRLDNIFVSGTTNETSEKYSFEYNTAVLPPYPNPTDNQQINNNSIWQEDYWGYYNGVPGNTLLPNFLQTLPGIVSGGISFKDMEPNGTYAKACMLTGVRYPSGGRTLFEYEPNSAPGYFVTTGGGGLRIKKITSYTDETSKAFVKTYEYDNNSTYSKPIIPGNYMYSSSEEHFVYYLFNTIGACVTWSSGTYRINKAFSNSLRPATIGNGAAVIYGSVTEYIGDETTNIGKTTYRYNSPDEAESRYPIPGDIDIRYLSTFHADCGNYNPELIEKTQYKFSNGTFEPVRSEEYEYTKYKQSEFNTGVSFASRMYLEGWGAANGDSPLLYYNQFDDSRYFNTLIYTDTKAFEEASVLTKNITKDYINSTTSVQTVTNFSYEPDYAQLRQKNVLTSDNKSLKTEYKYPGDFAPIEPYQSMISRNILSPVIEESVLKANQPLESVKTEYGFVSGNIIAPSTISTKKGYGSYETRMRYDAYDNFGNVLLVSKENDVKTSYIWGYNHTHPVAKIVGAEYSTAYNILTQAEKDALIKPANDAQVRTIIQKIRSHPSMLNALVHTYTYKPLVGVTSVTDENGLINYFEYDSFNRLQLMKDNDGNILKSYTYHNRKQ